MITKIGFGFIKNNCNFSDNYKSKKSSPEKNQHHSTVSIPDKVQAFYVPFLGSTNNKQNKLQNILFNSDPQLKTIFKNLQTVAVKEGYNEITTPLAFKYLLEETKDFIKKLDNDELDYKTAYFPPLASVIIDDYSSDTFEDKDMRKKILPVLDKYIAVTDKLIESEKPEIQTEKEPKISEYIADSIWSTKRKDKNISATDFADAVMDASNDNYNRILLDYWFDMCEALMLENKEESKMSPFSGYDNKAKNVLRNLEIGTNMFVTYDFEKDTPKSFIDTIYKNNDKDTRIIEFNKYATAEYFNNLVAKLGKNKDTKYIIIADPTHILANDTGLRHEDDNDDDLIGNIGENEDFYKTIRKHPDNVKFLFYDTKDNYYKASSSYPDFEETTIPALSVMQMIQFFKESPNVYKNEIKTPFTNDALEKIISASSQLDGKFPQKTISLMKKIESYNSGAQSITEQNVTDYLEEANYLFKKNNDDSSVEVIFDTNKRIKDIIGKESTKKEALALVKQIKSDKMGTKGIVIYSQDGYAGGGRRFTAKAIAGEAKVPYIEINAMDFGTKDVDLFGGGSLTPEKSIKKLFSVVTAQAETNPHKSAVLYIENFEYFSVGEMISTYHQKAMAQLLREMDRAEKAGFNILIAGSVSDPEAVGETMMKSFKFVDQVAVSTPANNKGEREQIIKNAAEKMNIEFDGNDNEKNKLISYTADLTYGFPFIYIKSLMKKAQSVASEREHEYITKSDMTEAYLQLTTGRPSINHINKHEKEIVASHECGHATNLTVMNYIAKSIGKEWHIPDKVNFVTLDPRGFYGGAVYDTQDKNKEVSFEKMFASLVYGFGGHSCEKYFYGMDGSWGITCDMEMARDDAMKMVRVMGMGAKTGKMTIFDDENPSDKTKQMLEDDERVILHNAKIVSDLITEIYADFNKKFVNEYSSKVGTGECLVDGDEFRFELNKWKSEQTPEKQRELALCDQTIVEIMEATKRGVEVQKKY